MQKDKELDGICIGCIAEDYWEIQPITGNSGSYRGIPIGFCNKHAD